MNKPLIAVMMFFLLAFGIVSVTQAQDQSIQGFLIKDRYNSVGSSMIKIGNDHASSRCTVTDALIQSQTKLYLLKGKSYEVKLAIITPNVTPAEVKFMVNGELTDSLNVGNKYILANGAVITLTAIRSNKATFTLDACSTLIGNCVTSQKSDILARGQTRTYTVGTKRYEVQAVYIGPTSAKLMVNGELTDSLSAGNKFILANGAVITVISIDASSKVKFSLEMSVGENCAPTPVPPPVGCATAPPVDGIMTQGQTQSYLLGEKTYEVQATYISATSAKLKINGELTDALAVDNEFILIDGTIIKIVTVEASSKLKQVRFQLKVGTCPTSSPCTDSDGGLDYNVKGSCADNTYNNMSDGCIVSNGDNNGYLREISCDDRSGSMRCEMNDYNCPNGCGDGACLASPPAPVCNAGYLCKDANTKAHQETNCDWSSITDCPNGCLNGECVVPPTCTSGSKCKDNNTKAYQQSNCSWSSITDCPNGCLNGDCVIPPPVCTAGFKCKDDTHQAYQATDCSWSQITFCPDTCVNGVCHVSCNAGMACKDANTKAYLESNCVWSQIVPCAKGCVNGACIDKSYTYAMTFSPEIKSDHYASGGYLEDFRNKKITFLGKTYTILAANHPAQNKIKFIFMAGAVDILDEGETKTYTLNGKDYVITASYVGPTEVKLKVNGQLTSSLTETQTYKLIDGVEVGIVDILAQNLAGEVDMVMFSLGADKLEISDSNTLNNQFDGVVSTNSGQSTLITAEIITSIDQGTQAGADVALSAIKFRYTQYNGQTESNTLITDLTSNNLNLDTTTFTNEYGTSTVAQSLVVN
jgi:hypothetical protein